MVRQLIKRTSDMGFLLCWLFAFVLLAATYNPTQWNYVRWTMTNYEDRLSIAVLAGLILLIGYIICLRATLRSIGFRYVAGAGRGWHIDLGAV
jgi:hypothetical protein